MRKLFSTVIMLLIMSTAYSQTIHWLTFWNTADPKIGKGCEGDREAIRNHFLVETNAALVSKGYKSNVMDFYGQDCNSYNCNNVCNKIQVGKEDIVVFYYSGHGGRPSVATDPNGDRWEEEHPYPQMCLGERDESKFVPQERVFNNLKNKGARLTIVITDCCNSEHPAITRKDVFNSPANKGPATISEQKKKNLQKLFLGYKGSLIATSSSPKQTSLVLPDNSISLYTGLFVDLYDGFEEFETSDINWDSFLGVIEECSDDITEKRQTPFHRSYLTECTIPEDRPVEVDENINTQTTTVIVENPTNGTNTDGGRERPNGEENVINNLSNNLCALSSPANSPTSRFNRERLLRENFTSTAIVKIMSQDGNIVIDKENAFDFLGRLAISKQILGVYAEKVIKNEHGKISELVVREVYPQR